MEFVKAVDIYHIDIIVVRFSNELYKKTTIMKGDANYSSRKRTQDLLYRVRKQQ